MGAWGCGIFENDSASDWVYQLDDAKDDTVLMKAFDAVIAADEYIDEDECSGALAAAAITVGLHDRKLDGLPEAAVDWINSGPKANMSALREKAIIAVEKVRNNPLSELRELWSEGEDGDEWFETIDELLAKMKQI